MKKRLVKWMAAVSAFAILLSQITASANFGLTAEKIIDSGATYQDSPWMLPGFKFDSAAYSYEPRSGRNETNPDDPTVYNTYGNYHGHMKWANNLIEKGWSAAASQNIYPVGIAGETDYSAIDSLQSYSAQKYTDYQIFDIEFWNGYMFVVMNRETWGDGDLADELHSVIQVYDVTNGQKAHVASWDFDDFDFGQIDETLSFAIRDIEVTDDNIFMLLDMKNGWWTHQKEWNTWGGALAVVNNHISRANGTYAMPTKSALQQATSEYDDRNWQGVDAQNGMRMRSELPDGSEFEVMGDYLVYIPRAGGDNFTQLNEDNKTHGVWITKWNDPNRAADAGIDFAGESFGDWLGITFPEGWFGAEYSHGGTPAMANFEIDGNYAYMDVEYTVADAESATGFTLYDKVYVIDMTDPVNPVVVGATDSFTGPWSSFAYPEYQLNRRMTVSDGFVYLGQYNWNGFTSQSDNYRPSVYIVDARNPQAPSLSMTLNIRDDFDIEVDYNNWGGIDAIAVVGDYALITIGGYFTLFVQLNKDRTEVVDYVWQPRVMSYGSVSGSPEPAVYGSRIFYPTVGNGGRDYPSTYTEDVIDPATGDVTGTVTKEYVDENGNWTGPSLDREFRYGNRIEVVDFSRAEPKGISVDDVQDNGNGTYTFSGTVQGVEITPALHGAAAVQAINSTTRQTIGSVYFDDLDQHISPENNVAGWTMTTTAPTPSNITFALTDGHGGVIPEIYEEVSLGIDSGDIPESTVNEEDLTVSVSFDKDYPDYENSFTVWGEYTGTEPDSIQILAAIYDSEGHLMQARAGEKVILAPEKPFAVEESIAVNENANLEGAELKVFIWSGTGGIRPLGQLFRVTDAAFTYTLENAARTSAGVYDQDGKLIRTLWSGMEEEAGTHTKSWDGRDEAGVLQADGTYSVTVMENNVEIVPDAYIGNTSDHSKQDYIISGYANFLSDMVYVDGKIFYIYPYSEGRVCIYYFDVDDTTRKAGEFGGTNRCMQRAVTDGNRLYFMNTEHCRDGQTRTFLYAFDLATQQMYMFQDNGQWLPSWGVDNMYYAVNVIEHARETFQTGDIAVQQNGNFLFNSYVDENMVYVLNKNNGSVISTTSFNDPRSLAYHDNNGLWIGYKQANGRYKAERYTVSSNGQLTKDNSINLEHDFGYILHLELSPDGRRIVVADGDTNQFKMYDAETGEHIWTYGNGESYEEDPTVSPEKLMLKHTGNKTDLVYSEFEDNNTLWIGDPGNNRTYKLDLSSGTPQVVDEIMTQPGSHSLGVDINDKTTIYSNAIQYEMDYEKSGVESWRMVKNWKKQVEAFGLDIVTFNQFNNFITLPNGKKYFSAHYDGTQKLFCMEDNYIRNTGINFDNKIMMEDGRVGSIIGEVINGQKVVVYRAHDIVGYNAANDPIIDENGTALAILPDDWNEPVHAIGGMKLNMPITDSGIMLTLLCQLQRKSGDKKMYHIGGVRLDDEPATDWLWKAAPEGSVHYDGNFPKDGTFEAGNGTWNAAQKIVTNGRNVVFQYNGEFYKSWQTNMLYFYRDNGLLVGVFGDAGHQRQTNENRDQYGKEIFPGNAFDMYYIADEQNSDRAYILQNNENGFGNFKYNVTGLDTIREHTSEITLDSALREGLTYRYYVGDSSDPANCIQKAWRPTVGSEPYTAGDDFEMRYTGYMTNPNGGDNLKLTISSREDVILKIGNQVVHSGTGKRVLELDMEEGKLYPFSLTVMKNASSRNGRTTVVMAYTDNNNKTQILSEKNFKTDALPYTRPDIWEVDLLEGLPFASILDDGTYGITRGTPSDVDGIGLLTNVTNPSVEDVRDIRFGTALWPVEGGMWPRSAWFAKNLGTPRDNMTNWKLEMDVARGGYMNYGELGNQENSTGSHIDILDINDRVIARFYWGTGNKAFANNQEIYQSNNLYHNNLNAEIYTVPHQYENDFNTPSPLIISGRDGNIIFEYYGQEITVPVLDEEAQWDKPLKIRVDAFYNYGLTNAREMSLSFTKLNYKQYLAD